MAQTFHRYRVGDEPVPGYRLTQFLGKGGFGEVFKAMAPGGVEVAMKIIDLTGQQGPEEFKSLRVVKRIRNPYLIQMQAVWLKDENGRLIDDHESNWSQLDKPVNDHALRGTAAPTAIFNAPVELVIAMQLGDQSLFNLLEDHLNRGEQGIPIDRLIEYMNESARGIDFLNSPIHDLGQTQPQAIVHGDIKPHNILLVGGAAAICDFGLAHAVDNLRKTSQGPLTVAYAAPESFRGKQGERSDQYSLAISYVELRTGRLPFDPALNPYEVMVCHATGKLDFSRLSEDEAEVLRRATALEPENRWPSALKFVKALRNAAGAGSVRIPATSSTVEPPLPPAKTGKDDRATDRMMHANTAVAPEWNRDSTPTRKEIQYLDVTASAPRPKKKRTGRKFLALLLLLAAIGGGVALWKLPNQSSFDQGLAELLQQHKFKESRDWIDQQFPADRTAQQKTQLLDRVKQDWKTYFDSLVEKQEFRAASELLTDQVAPADALESEKQALQSRNHLAWSAAVNKALEGKKFDEVDKLLDSSGQLPIDADEVQTQDFIKQLVLAWRSDVDDLLKDERFRDAATAIEKPKPAAVPQADANQLKDDIHAAWRKKALSYAGESTTAQLDDLLAKNTPAPPLVSPEEIAELRTRANPSPTKANWRVTYELAMKRGQFMEALQALDEAKGQATAEELTPLRRQARDGWLALAWQDFQAEHYDAAADTCQKILSRFNDDAEARLLRARALNAATDVNAARTELAALDPKQIDPTWQFVYQGLGLATQATPPNQAELVKALKQHAEFIEAYRQAKLPDAWQLTAGEQAAVRDRRVACIKALADWLDSKSADPARQEEVLSLISNFKPEDVPNTSSAAIGLKLAKLQLDRGQLEPCIKTLARLKGSKLTPEEQTRFDVLSLRAALLDPSAKPAERTATIDAANALILNPALRLGEKLEICTALAEHVNDGGLTPDRLATIVDEAFPDRALPDKASKRGLANLLTVSIIRRLNSAELLNTAASKKLLKDCQWVADNDHDTPFLAACRIESLLDTQRVDDASAIEFPTPGQASGDFDPYMNSPQARCQGMFEAGLREAAADPYVSFVKARRLTTQASNDAKHWAEIESLLRAAYPGFNEPPAAGPLTAAKRREQGRAMLVEVVARGLRERGASGSFTLVATGAFHNKAAAANAYDLLRFAGRLWPDDKAGNDGRIANLALAAWHKEPRDEKTALELSNRWIETAGATDDAKQSLKNLGDDGLAVLNVRLQAKLADKRTASGAASTAAQMMRLFRAKFPTDQEQAVRFYDMVMAPALAIGPIKRTNVADDEAWARFYGDSGEFVRHYPDAPWSFKQSPTAKQIELFTQSLGLVNTVPRYYVDRGHARLELPIAQFKEARDDANAASKLVGDSKPLLMAAQGLKGHVDLVDSRQEGRWKGRVDKLDKACNLLQQALDLNHDLNGAAASEGDENYAYLALVHQSEARLELAKYQVEDRLSNLHAARDSALAATREKNVPSLATAYACLGNACEELAWSAHEAPAENFGEAVKAMTTSLKAEAHVGNALQKHPELRFNLGRLYYKLLYESKTPATDVPGLHSSREAVEKLCHDELQRAIDDDPDGNVPEARVWLARFHERKDQWTEAAKLYDQIKQKTDQEVAAGESKSAEFLVAWAEMPLHKMTADNPQQTASVEDKKAVAEELRKRAAYLRKPEFVVAHMIEPRIEAARIESIADELDGKTPLELLNNLATIPAQSEKGNGTFSESALIARKIELRRHAGPLTSVRLSNEQVHAAILDTTWLDDCAWVADVDHTRAGIDRAIPHYEAMHWCWTAQQFDKAIEQNRAWIGAYERDHRALDKASPKSTVLIAESFLNESVGYAALAEHLGKRSTNSSAKSTDAADALKAITKAIDLRKQGPAKNMDEQIKLMNKVLAGLPKPPSTP